MLIYKSDTDRVFTTPTYHKTIIFYQVRSSLINHIYMKKYNVSIEQPMCRTFEVVAENIESAIELTTEKYNNGEFVIGSDDIGTDAQIKAID